MAAVARTTASIMSFLASDITAYSQQERQAALVERQAAVAASTSIVKEQTMSTVGTPMVNILDGTLETDSDFDMMWNEELELERTSYDNLYADDMAHVIMPAYEQHEAYHKPIRDLEARFQRNAQQKAMLAALTDDDGPSVHTSGNVRTLTLQEVCESAPQATDDSDSDDADTTDWQALIASVDGEAKALLEAAKAAQEAQKAANAAAKAAKEAAKAALDRAQAAKAAAPVVITPELAATIAKIRALASADDQTIAKALVSGLLRQGSASKPSAPRSTSAPSEGTPSGESLAQLHKSAIYAGIRAGKGDSQIGRELGISSKVVWHTRRAFQKENATV